MTTAQDGCTVVSLKHRPPLPLRNTPGTHFCYRLSRPQDQSVTGRIMSLKNSNDTIRNRTCDLPDCSVVRFSEVQIKNRPHAPNNFTHLPDTHTHTHTHTQLKIKVVYAHYKHIREITLYKKFKVYTHSNRDGVTPPSKSLILMCYSCGQILVLCQTYFCSS